MPSLNVNTDDVVELSRRLTKIKRSSLPVAVRQTLNSVAFKNKQTDLQKSAQANFINRDSRFFKAFSRVDMARGFNVNKMAATSGIIKSNSDAVKNLSQQEYGGNIDRSLVPLDTARTGKSNSKKVTTKNRLGKLGSIPKGGGRTTSKKGIATLARRAGKGNLIVTGVSKRRVYRVMSLSKNSFKLKGLYTLVDGRKVSIKATGFVRKSGIASSSALERNFVKFAKLQINKNK